MRIAREDGRMHARKPSISGLMWLVLLTGIALWLARDIPGEDLLRRLPFWLLAAWIAFSWIWFVVVPQKSLWLARHKPDRQRRLLEWVVNTPWPPGAKTHARYILAANLQAAGHHARAESQWRFILRDNPRIIEPRFRVDAWPALGRLARALGRPEQADAERARAARILTGARASILTHQAQGQLFDRAHRV